MLRPVRRRPVFVDNEKQPETFYLDIRIPRHHRGALGARIEVNRFACCSASPAILLVFQQFSGDPESGITGAKFIILDPGLPIPTAIDSATAKSVRPPWFIEDELEKRLGSDYHKFHFPVEGYWPETRHKCIPPSSRFNAHTYLMPPESCQLLGNLTLRANI